MDKMGGIITGGLGVPAGSGLITTKFHLGGFFSVTVVVEPPITGPVGGVSGGSVPIAPGRSAQVLQRPVQTRSQSAQAPQYYVPYKPATPMQQVIIKVKLGATDYEKNYLVPGFVPNVILRTSDIINKTKDLATFIVKALRLPNKISVTLNKYNKTK